MAERDTGMGRCVVVVPDFLPLCTGLLPPHASDSSDSEKALSIGVTDSESEQ